MSYSSERRHSDERRSPPDSAMAMSIPIPPHSHSYGAERSPDSGRSLVSPSSRSPQPSLSSYRSHPYPRRHSVSTQAASTHEDPRIYLPPPNSAAPLQVLHEHRDRDRDRDHEQRSPHDARDRDREWHDRRPSLGRAHSDRYGDRGFQLPSFATFSASSSAGPLTPTGNMGPPSSLPTTSPGGSRAASPKMYPLGGLRPSYSYEPGTNGSGSRQNLSVSTNGPTSSYRNDPSPSRYNERTSPPLKPVGNGYGSDQYMPPRQSRSHVNLSAQHSGRARSHSAASALSNYSGGQEGDWAGPQTPQPQPSNGGGGQNRRVAHLLSEQKRRESINTGFKALRTTLPSSVPTDSKAIVLRKAVSHILHLEDLLRQNGIPVGPAPTGAQPPNLHRGDSGSTQGDEEENEDEDEDVEMRQATGGVATLKVDKVNGEWAHVENATADRKPAISAIA